MSWKFSTTSREGEEEKHRGFALDVGALEVLQIPGDVGDQELMSTLGLAP